MTQDGMDEERRPLWDEVQEILDGADGVPVRPTESPQLNDQPLGEYAFRASYGWGGFSGSVTYRFSFGGEIVESQEGAEDGDR